MTNEVGVQLANCRECAYAPRCTEMDVRINYVVRREFGRLKNCAKRTFVYKAVEEKKRSAEHRCIVGRKLYGGRSTWSLNDGVQICTVRYEVTKTRKGTEDESRE